MKNILLIILVVTLIGCASAQPNFYKGKYYMTGGSNCQYTTERTDDTLNCFDTDHKPTGYTRAMTNQQLQMYQHNQQMSQQKNTNCYKTYNGGINCTTY